MVELVSVLPGQKLESKSKETLDALVGEVIDYLKKQPQGETVDNLASKMEVSTANIRRILGIIAVVTAKVSPLFIENEGAKIRLLLTRSPKGTVTATRFEVVLPGPRGSDLDSAEVSDQKPTYSINPTDIAEIQRVWKRYKATGRAFRHEEADRIAPLFRKFPYLFTQNPAKTAILPTMALFTVAKTIEEYACLGRLPDAIETPVAIITFADKS